MAWLISLVVSLSAPEPDGLIGFCGLQAGMEVAGVAVVPAVKQGWIELVLLVPTCHPKLVGSLNSSSTITVCAATGELRAANSRIALPVSQPRCW